MLFFYSLDFQFSNRAENLCSQNKTDKTQTAIRKIVCLMLAFGSFFLFIAFLRKARNSPCFSFIRSIFSFLIAQKIFALKIRRTKLKPQFRKIVCLMLAFGSFFLFIVFLRKARNSPCFSFIRSIVYFKKYVYRVLLKCNITHALRAYHCCVATISLCR